MYLTAMHSSYIYHRPLTPASCTSIVSTTRTVTRLWFHRQVHIVFFCNCPLLLSVVSKGTCHRQITGHRQVIVTGRLLSQADYKLLSQARYCHRQVTGKLLSQARYCHRQVTGKLLSQARYCHRQVTGKLLSQASYCHRQIIVTGKL